jgi:hypothetical protein
LEEPFATNTAKEAAKGQSEQAVNGVKWTLDNVKQMPHNGENLN